MSISSTTSRMSYTGNGAVDTYSYTFKIYDDDEILVTVRNTSDVETTLVKTTDYTVTGVGSSSGGTVVLVNSAQAWLDGDGDLLTGYVLTIRRVRPLTQTTDIRNAGTYYPESHEDAFDKMVMIDQQQQDEIGRSVKLAETVASSVFDPTLPADIGTTPNKVMMTNDAGDGWALEADCPTAGDISAASVSAAAADASADAAAASAVAADASADAAALSEAAALAYSTSVTALASYVDDAAYVSANGAAQNSDVYYNSTAHKARLYANGSWQYLGGGGGGSSFQWIEGTDSPTSVFEYSGQVFVFEDAVDQYLYARVRVPSTYSAGSQISLLGVFYANGTSNTVLLKTLSTLIRTGTDAISSTTNQRTSTNSAVTLATTANRPNAFICDLTSSTGTINSVAVSAGDLILVRLTRDTTTDTFASDAMFPAYSTEVTFA